MFKLTVTATLLLMATMGLLSVVVHRVARQSPAGQQVVYVASVSARRQLYIADLDRDITRRLHISDSHDDLPDVSPVTRDIVFVSDRDGDTDLYLLSADGRDLRQLTHNDHSDAHPQWSADGTTILYEANPNTVAQIFELTLADSTIAQVTGNTTAFTRPMWSPDETQLAYDSGGEIYIYDLTDDTSIPLTDDGFWDQHPIWSPDGRGLVYESNRGRDWVLQWVDWVTGEVVSLSQPNRTDRNATFTNDPNRIVFQSTRLFPGRLYTLTLDQPKQVHEIAIPPPAGHELYLLFGMREVLEPDWTDILEPAWVR